MERAHRFHELVAKERELQEFLLELKFKGRTEQILEQRRAHDEALAEIDRIRMQEIVPIVAELHGFLQAIEGRKNGHARP